MLARQPINDAAAPSTAALVPHLPVAAAAVAVV